MATSQARARVRRAERALDASGRDLAEAQRAPAVRRQAEALAAYATQVPRRVASVTLPDPADPARKLFLELDPALAPHENAARYFKRAAKAERGLKQVAPRLSATEAEAHELEVLLARVAALEEGASDTALVDDGTLDQTLDYALAKLPLALRAGLRAAGAAAAAPAPRAGGVAAVARGNLSDYAFFKSLMSSLQ